MKRILYSILLLLLPLMAQADLLTEILRGDYAPKMLSAAEQDSILNGADGQRYRLDFENKRVLFRHSFEADYYVVDTQKNTRKPLADSPVRDPIISPNGKYIAYAVGNKLHIHKLDFGTEVAVSSSTNDEIFEGVTDWLYEEEFGLTHVMAFSPDSKQLAFLRVDETSVPTFDWQEYMFGETDPQSDELMQYPKTVTLRYPKAGCTNARAEVCVYDIQTKAIRVMKLPEMDDAYLPRLSWTNPQTKGKETIEAELVVLRLNRDQNQMEVFLCNPRSTVCRSFYREQSKDCYVDYALFDEWQWLSDNRVVLVSEKSGWRQAYLYSAQGRELQTLTKDGVDVMRVYGMDEATNTLYYLQADSPQTRTGYALNMKKNVVTRITEGEGMHQLRFSTNYKQMIDCYESVHTPNQYTLYNVRGSAVGRPWVVQGNDSLQQAWDELGLPEKEWFSFTTERGDVLNGWVLTPTTSHDGRGYPVVFTQYSGPDSQRVLNRWRRTWDYYLVNQGYMVVCVDGRGTGARGRAWRNMTYMNLGEKEAEDQISAAKHVATWANVDANRMAMVGWSYGGFQVLRTMSEPLSPFHAGIAIAPVTDWRLYDSAYTERYMRRPQVNEDGYDAADLSQRAADLQGELLIVHGLADDNVHAQNTLLYVDALVQAGKQFQMQLYPDDDHHLRKRANYEHLHRRLMTFLKDKL